MSSPPDRSRQQASRQQAPLVVLLATLMLSVLAALYVWYTSTATQTMRFENAASNTEDNIRAILQSRIDNYVALMRGASGLFAVDKSVGPAEFSAYVDRLMLREKYPGMRGIGYAQRIEADNRQQVETQLRGEGIKDFSIWPDTRQAEMYPVTYLAPQSPGRGSAEGFDMFSDPPRHAAMVQARDSGQAAVTSRVMLVNHGSGLEQPGFDIYLPLYRSGSPPGTAADRQAQIIGFIFCPFRAGTLEVPTGKSNSDAMVRYRVYDGQTVASSNELFDSLKPTEMLGDPTITESSLDVAGRPWAIVFDARRTQSSLQAWVAGTWVMAGGIAVALALYLVMRRNLLARQQAERIAAELVRSEEALRQSESVANAARQEAETANRTKDDFLATLSHELRTPLNAILGWAQLLELGGDPDELQHGLKTIERNARVQAQLVEDLLDLSRITSGKLRLDIKPIDPAAVVAAALDSVAPSADAKQITIDPQLDSHAGSIRGDADRLQQVIWNLLSNAIKFTPPGGNVTARLFRAGNSAVIEISDSGQGIEPEFLPHVFERLRQADSTSTRRHGGLGLGLAIVRHLVEAHGGTVEAKSAGAGRGATFRVALPLAHVEPPIHADGSAPPAGQPLAGVQILVVEDDSDARDLLVNILGRQGAQVTAVESADRAMNRLCERPPTVLISDICMPGEDGYAFLRRVRSLQSAVSRIPAVALSAMAGREDRQRAIDAGFQRHVAKPIRAAELTAVIAELIGAPAAQK
ncbi:MAG TPA: CHASE domain-containing protein [Tepidisphaeraceae bacterium]|nr:CHASE domain-containing protein [Tepidisphaeraceae bacterium]